MSTKQIDFKFIPTPDQSLALRDTSRELMVGGGMAGGKTYFMCAYIFLYAIKYPGARIVLARRKFTQLSTSTLESFKSVAPRETYNYNIQKNIINFANGSKVFCTGLDMAEDLDKFSSTELALVCIDQAEEIEESHYLALITRLRQKTPDGKEYPYKILTSCNPRICYLRDRFVLNPIPGLRTFIKFAWQNNPYLRRGYIDEQKVNLKNTPNLYASLIEGSWDILDNTNSVIKYNDAMFCASVGQEHIKAHTTRRGVSCDSAREGDDSTVIYCWQGTKIMSARIEKGLSVPAVASLCVAECKKIGGNWIAIDTASQLGQGSYDIMKELISDTTYLQLFPVNCSKESSNAMYLNLRAEMYFILGQYISSNIITIPNDPILIADLVAHTYQHKLDKLKITSKEDIKRGYTLNGVRHSGLGRSPDRGDACAIGIYALDRLVKDHETQVQEHYRDDRPLDYVRDSDRVSYDNQPVYDVEDSPNI